MRSSAESPPLVVTDSSREIEYRRLFDLSQDLLCVAGLDGYFKQVNPSWTRILGWSEEELLSRPVADFMHPDDRDRTLQARAGLARGVPVQGLENRYLCSDGSYRWLSWQSSIDLGLQRVYAVARDITERRRLDHEQLVFSKLECTGILAGGLAHDFNNILASLQLSLDMVSVVGLTNPVQESHLRHARAAVQTATALTNQLITFAKGGNSERRILDAKRLLTQAADIALLGSALRREYVIDPDLWPIEVDEAQISQVISGIVMNAREAMGVNGLLRLEAHNVTLAALPGPSRGPGDYVCVRVIDCGTGIPPEILGKVFDPYFSTKERGARKGMGLGLTICRSVLQKHGGDISIESLPGHGTIVTCHLPRALGAGTA